ncbi:metallophosphoesterase [Caryophanon tenue]|uniref:Calcineurin-like phosphoesterase domain-containing protein n=1 Tax=Caryophanon tenue TaxID=33978 RepID=A0A1C0Y736_9BACL|nr:metallophosphoesterase [Caryophanon tenue]OCS82968.1 hypothetical protein A6M13_06085 [Caryophanon tenue]
MTRILAISDIHGQYDELTCLLELAHYNADRDQLILCGDYVDRGPKSKEVVELAQQLERQGAIVLCGNHEAIMYDAFYGSYEGMWYHWLDTCRGDATLRSYGIDPHKTSPHHKPRTKALTNTLQWMHTLPLYYETDDAIFVHAGVNDKLPLHKNSKRTLLWVRDDFHDNYRGKKHVIFGHTTTPRLHRDPHNSSVYFGDNRIIGIDGASSLGGQLHCLEYPSLHVYSV